MQGYRLYIIKKIVLEFQLPDSKSQQQAIKGMCV